MKQKTFLMLLTFFTLILSGCQEKSSPRKSSTSNNNTACTGEAYWTTPGCAGYNSNNANNTNCAGQAYWTTPGCSGYCQYNPSGVGCGSSTGTTTGSTTGTTTGSTGATTGICATNPSAPYCSPTYCTVTPRLYGCLSNGTNCYTNPTAAGCGGSSKVVTPNPYWGMFYPPSGNPPAGSCSSTYAPSGLSSALETRKGSIIIAGGGRNATDPETEYSPFSPTAPNYLNTSTMLKSVADAKLFYLTDAVLKLRIKVNPEPEAHGTSGVCYGRNTGSYLAGYTKLQYYVKVYGVTSNNGVSYLNTLGPYSTAVNSCSPAIDLSSYQEMNPRGIVVSINNVQENKNCTGSFWTSTGYTNCNLFNKVRSMECWSMEFEVAADGTKTFD